MTAKEDVQSADGCFPKIANSYRTFLSSLSIRHPIHPLAPIAPVSSEFIVIDSQIHLRVIHLSPDGVRQTITNDPRTLYSTNTNSIRNSLSEEYWFTKWNKSLKIGNNCSCSFRRSIRFSQISNNKSSNNCNRQSFTNVPPRRITNVATFVERIVQDTFYEAFQEYYIIKNKKLNSGGLLNLAYVKNEDDDCEVILRKKKLHPNNGTRKIGSEIKQNHHLKCNNHKKNNVKKPFILLFHGIGMSADVWWLVLTSLANKGFEVIAPDMLGHGYSSAPGKSKSYSFHKLLLHAITIFDHYLGGDEKNKCILIGHSYGCSLVSALYKHRTSQILQIVLIGGGGPTPLAPALNNIEISPFGCIHVLFKPLLLCGMKRTFIFSSRGKHFDVCDPEPGIPSQILDYIKNGQNWPEGDAAFHRRIHVPTLLVHGLQDKQITLVQQCEMERTIPRAFLELIPNAGHLPMLETPEHLCHMILCFIDTWS